MTTFARIAKILKGLIEPRNWVEEAFTDIGGGGGGTFEVTDTVEGNVRTLNKTFGEIQNAIEEGKMVWINLGTFKQIATTFQPVVRLKTHYVGTIGIETPSPFYWEVSGQTEEEARNSYPSHSGG